MCKSIAAGLLFLSNYSKICFVICRDKDKEKQAAELIITNY